MLTDFYQDTWYAVQGDDMQVETSKGTCPGDTLADLMFDIAVQPMVLEIRTGIESLGLVIDLPAPDISIFRAVAQENVAGFWPSTEPDQKLRITRFTRIVP